MCLGYGWGSAVPCPKGSWAGLSREPSQSVSGPNPALGFLHAMLFTESSHLLYGVDVVIIPTL